jgi:hypothetical protein
VRERERERERGEKREEKGEGRGERVDRGESGVRVGDRGSEVEKMPFKMGGEGPYEKVRVARRRRWVRREGGRDGGREGRREGGGRRRGEWRVEGAGHNLVCGCRAGACHLRLRGGRMWLRRIREAGDGDLKVAGSRVAEVE